MAAGGTGSRPGKYGDPVVTNTGPVVTYTGPVVTYTGPVVTVTYCT